MSGCAGGDEPTKISDLKYVIPFGRYVGASRVAPEADQVLVGRDGHRAYFVDLLINAGRTGAFLVTGRRGTGKTSFVRHCIAEYENAILKRFLGHNVGRAFWDRVMVILFWALLLLGGLLLSEVAQLLVLVSLKGLGSHAMLLWVILVPIGIVLLFPSVYARAVFEVVIESFAGRKQERTRFSHVLATFLIMTTLLVAAVAMWFVSSHFHVLQGLSSPCWTVSALFIALSTLYLGGQVVSLGRPRHGVKPEKTALAIRTLVVLMLAEITIWTLLESSKLIKPSQAGFLALTKPVALNFGVGLLMLGGGLYFRGWHQHQGVGSPNTPTLTALRRGGKNYAIPGLLMLFITCIAMLGEMSNLAPLVILAPVAVLSAVGFGMIESDVHSSVQPPPAFHPYSRLALTAGALISITLALQLAQPVLRPLLGSLLAVCSPILVWFWPHLAQSLGTVQNRPTIVSETLSQGSGFVFGHYSEVLFWLGLVLLLLVLLHFVQYEWIVRAHSRSREEEPPDLGDRPPWEDQEILSKSKTAKTNRWRIHRQMAELTLPWAVYRIWLPSLAVSVNLGVESKLGTDRVIQAMLVGLRDIYHRTFTAWTAGPANIGRVGGFLVLLILVTLAGDTWFKLPSTEDVKKWAAAAEQARAPRESIQNDEARARRLAHTVHSGTSVCTILTATQEVRQVLFPDLVCRLGQGWFNLLYLNLVPEQLQLTSAEGTHNSAGRATVEKKLLLYFLIPYREPTEAAQTCDAGSSSTYLDCRWKKLLAPGGIHFNVYHLFLFLGIAILARSVVRRLPILPYWQNLRRIDDLLDSMTSRTRVIQRPTLWEPARWIYNLVADRVRETEQEPLDSRTVELAFLHIMEDIQRGGVRMPGIARSHLNLPAPEITFVFDELDKLGARVDPEEREISPQATELRAIQADQERALQLRRLLSDLKNILSSASARFIFIGGRNLHDEWLADQTARQPLLTNIFIAEVYLPSLLTDDTAADLDSADAGRRHQLHRRIQEYAIRQYERSYELYEEWTLKGFRHSLALSPTTLAPERFAIGSPKSTLARKLHVYEIRTNPDGQKVCIPITKLDLMGVPEALIEHFVDFLTLRSMGNPKRLKELLASFIRPMRREVPAAHRWELPCLHVLRFRDGEVFRIQLIASIYRQLAAAFETRMVQRDDKMAISIFFLSDFLFKFHRRAFSWANLERVDELAHIHRAPDLRELQEEMVELVSERFLHRVLNGMYSFRFRSDVAREVEYLSRCSAAEMAALNFTLDESQSLKAIYRNSLDRREQLEGPNPGLVAGLGELYEFDQEYETARYHYRHAIDILDKDLCERTGSPDTVREILQGQYQGMEDARTFLPWGEARLRLMLQIGMTFEIARSLEHAVTEYRTARTLARALVKACLGLDIKEQWWRGLLPVETSQAFHTGRFHTLKSLNILFQPLFAEAWASEKITSTVDTSNLLIETGLWEIRKTLPFVDTPEVQLSHSPPEPVHANLALSLAQLHNKAGDLYFFKGRQPVTWEQLTDADFWKMVDKKSGEAGHQGKGRSHRDLSTEGYLLRAHYHYAVSLHEIRRYVFHRIKSSRYRLSLAARGGETLLGEALPDLLYRAVANSVNDMAEATLGRVSLFGLLRALNRSPLHENLEVVDVERELITWLQFADGQTSKPRKLIEGNDHLSDLPNWLGVWNKPRRKADRKKFKNPRLALITFKEPSTPQARFLISIHLCKAGARLFEKGGYLEDAARELLQVCWIVLRLLYWFSTIDLYRSWTVCPEDGPRHTTAFAIANEIDTLEEVLLPAGKTGCGTRAFVRQLAEFAITALEDSKSLFLQSRQRLGERQRETPRHEGHEGDLIPADAFTQACGLGLWLEAQDIETRKGLIDRVRKITSSWNQMYARMGFAASLRAFLEAQRYPLLNRLNALQILVDDHTLNPASRTPERAAKLHLEELLDLNEQYAAPLHFTPLQTGTTCALFWLEHCRRDDAGVWVRTPFAQRVFQTARRELRASEEMCSLRRRFYETVADLYYLYDDFNDRQVHFKHALQMTATELTTLHRHLLEVAGKRLRLA